MFKLLKGGICYTPKYIGKKDILIVMDKIGRIEENIAPNHFWDIEVIDCSKKIICPGFIDQHVHIIGGGGEEGPISRIAELTLDNIITAGVTTVVGVLGVDAITRSISSLLAKARSLELEGITAYIYTGSYSVPTATLTGTITSDMVWIDKVIGVGEIAISDHRSSHPSLQQLKALVSEARVGGLLGGKAGIVHIHVGDGKDGIKSLVELINQSEFPIDMFVPTHLNRNKNLFRQAINFNQKGGIIDLAAGEDSEIGYSIPDAIEILMTEHANIDRITVSSDGNGSMAQKHRGGTGVGKVEQLFEDIRDCILYKNIGMEQTLKVVTSNVAKVLKIYPQKGCISIGSDADVLVLNSKDLNIDIVISRGEVLMQNRNRTDKSRY